MATENGYPIADVYILQPVKGWFNRASKRLDGVPTARSGLQAVLEVDGQYELVPPGTPLRSADGIVQAAQVMFVDVRPTVIAVSVEPLCRGGHGSFTVDAQFECEVIDAVALLEAGEVQFRDNLSAWLSRTLRPLGSGYDLQQAQDLEAAAWSVLNQQLTIDAPIRGGGAVDIRLIDFRVALNEAEAQHLRDLEERRRDRERIIGEASVQDLRDSTEHERNRKRKGFQRDLDYEDEQNRLQTDEFDRARRIRKLASQEREAAAWLRAIDAGPDALYAMLLAADPTAIDRAIAQKIEDRGALEAILKEAIASGRLDPMYVEDILFGIGERVVSSRLGGAASIGASERQLGKRDSGPGGDTPNASPNASPDGEPAIDVDEASGEEAEPEPDRSRRRSRSRGQVDYENDEELDPLDDDFLMQFSDGTLRDVPDQAPESENEHDDADGGPTEGPPVAGSAR